MYPINENSPHIFVCFVVVAKQLLFFYNFGFVCAASTQHTTDKDIRNTQMAI